MNDLTIVRPAIQEDRHLYGSFMPAPAPRNRTFIARAEAIAVYIRSQQPTPVKSTVPGCHHFVYQSAPCASRRAA